MRRDDRFDDNYPRDNNFDRMYDARDYRDRDRYDGYEDNYRDRVPERRNPREDYREREPRRYDRYEEREPEPRKRSFFSRDRRKRDREEIEVQSTGANDFVVLTPKSFEDIQGIIDNLKIHRALVIDLCRLNTESIQRVMDYVNGAIYALDGSIQRINPGVFLLTPTGMGISVPIDYIKDKWEKNKRR